VGPSVDDVDADADGGAGVGGGIGMPAAAVGAGGGIGIVAAGAGAGAFPAFCRGDNVERNLAVVYLMVGDDGPGLAACGWFALVLILAGAGFGKEASLGAKDGNANGAVEAWLLLVPAASLLEAALVLNGFPQ
jgi:hypothetical protein